MEKHYDGPDGIFYDAQNDCIFALKKTGGFIGKTRRFKRAIGAYDIYFKSSRPLVRSSGVIAWKRGQIIRLDDLPPGWPNK